MNKQTEALKLAQDLRALADKFSEGWHEGIKIDASDIVLLSEASEALAEQPAQHRHISYVCPQCYWSLDEQPAQPKLSDYEPDGMRHNKPQKRPQNCGTGYCSCIECPYEQPASKQEPVAYIHRQGNHWEVSERFLCDDEKARGWTEEPLYTSPPASKPLPEDYTAMEQALTRLQKRYAELEGKASKPWVGLTDEERRCIRKCNQQHDAFARAIEAKLKEKNA